MAQLALVTGASSGIGYNLAQVFAENDFDLVIVSNSDGLAEAAVAFKSLGVDVHPIKADLASYEGVNSFWQQVEALGRPLAAAALNAGVGVGGLFAETDLDAEINLVRLNVEGTKESQPYDVARQGFEALMKDEKNVYAASLKTKVEGAIANFVPDSVKAAMHDKMSKPTDET